MTILSFQRAWLSLNAGGYAVCLALLFMQGHGIPTVLRYAVLTPLFTLVALVIVIRTSMRWEVMDVPPDTAAPDGMWRAAFLFSLLTVGTTMVAILTIDRIEDYSWLFVVLGGWIGCNIGNWLHYRSEQ